jgi:hypothetical protein
MNVNETGLNRKNDSTRTVTVENEFSSIDIAKMSADIASQSGWHLVKIQRNNHQWIVTLDNVNGVYLQDRIARVLTVLHRDAPGSITEFVLQLQQHQLPLLQETFHRQAWMMKNITLVGPSKESLAEGKTSEYASNFFDATDYLGSYSSKTIEVTGVKNNSSENYLLSGPEEKRFTSGLDLGYQQTIGGPDGYLFAFSGQARGDLRLWDGAWINGVASLRLLDNYGKFTY